MFRGEKTYDTVLSPICNIKSVLKPNSCGKIYVLNSLLNSTYLIPVVVLVSYVTVSQSTHVYIISFDHHRIFLSKWNNSILIL